MAVEMGNIPMPIGNTYRGFGSDLFNSENISREDWLRSEQSAQLDYERSLDYFERQKAFTREQNEYNLNLANTSYQRAVEDLKKAGLNPILAYSQGGAESPMASSVSGSRSSGRSSSSSSRSVDSSSIILATAQLLKIAAGFLAF